MISSMRVVHWGASATAPFYLPRGAPRGRTVRGWAHSTVHGLECAAECCEVFMGFAHRGYCGRSQQKGARRDQGTLWHHP